MSGAPLHPAVEAVRARALTLWKPGNRYSIATDADTFLHWKQPSVLIAIATRHGSVVVAMGLQDWLDPAEMPVNMILEFVGCESATPYEKAVTELSALPKK